jgi:hypothetical protein
MEKLKKIVMVHGSSEDRFASSTCSNKRPSNISRRRPRGRFSRIIFSERLTPRVKFDEKRPSRENAVAQSPPTAWKNDENSSVGPETGKAGWRPSSSIIV